MRYLVSLMLLCCVWQSTAAQDRLHVRLKTGADVTYSLDDIDCLTIEQDNPMLPSDTIAEALDLGLSVRWASFNVGARRDYQPGRLLTPSEAEGAWGAEWRVPTEAEWQELLDNTSVEWVVANGVTGRRLTARNGRSLFLPLVGFGLDATVLSRGAMGIYWTSTDDELLTTCRKGTYLDSGNVYIMEFSRTLRAGVRLVQ